MLERAPPRTPLLLGSLLLLEGPVLPDGHARDVEVSFVGVPHTTLRGRIRTPDGRGAGRVDVLCRGVVGGTITNVTT